jgi:hypothetical protein
MAALCAAMFLTIADLQLYRLAEILLAGGDPSAHLAHELAVPHQFLIFLGITDLEAEIVQIAKMFIVSEVRHFCFSHDSTLS